MRPYWNRKLSYCSLQVGCHSQWFMLDSVVSMVDTVWLTLAIHGFSVLRNHNHVSLRAYALIPIDNFIITAEEF